MPALELHSIDPGKHRLGLGGGETVSVAKRFENKATLALKTAVNRIVSRPFRAFMGDCMRWSVTDRRWRLDCRPFVDELTGAPESGVFFA